MRIGIDIESGERPFQELVNGALKSLKVIPSDIYIYLIGNANKIIKHFPLIEKDPRVTLMNAPEVVYMDENPVRSLKRKKHSTVNVGINLLKNNEIDVFFSPGNTGATVVASILNLGMIDGIKRPSMATFFPRIGGGETLILDIGANPDTTEKNLYHNAILGLAYYKLIWNKPMVTVGLLNMGEEFSKGSSVIKKAFSYLRDIPGFIGNVEGYNVFNGSVDIVVCNGFTGNSILKISEAIKKYVLSLLRDVFTEKPSTNIVTKIISYTNSMMGLYTQKKKVLMDKMLPRYYGAAPLLGVNGTVLIGHGACSGTELLNAIELAWKLFQINYLDELKSNTKKLLKKD